MKPRQPWAAALLGVYFALVTLVLAQPGLGEQEKAAALYGPASESDRLFNPFQEIDLCLKNDGCTDPSLPFCVKQGLVRRCVQCRWVLCVICDILSAIQWNSIFRITES